MESNDAGDTTIINELLKSDKDSKSTSEVNPMGQNGASTSGSEGFVILCPNRTVNQGKEDEMSVSAWVEGRLALMNINPTRIDLEQLRAKKQSTKKRLASILTRRKSRKDSSDDSDLDNAFILSRQREGCAIWKFMVLQEMKNRNKSPSSPGKKRSNQSDEYEKEECNLRKVAKDKTRKSKSLSAGEFTPPEESKKELVRLYKGLDEIFKNNSQSEDPMWVGLTTSDFKNPKEVEVLEEMSYKYEFSVLFISGPYKSNIFRTLVTIAERREQILYEKGLLDPRKDELLFHPELNQREDKSSGGGQRQTDEKNSLDKCSIKSVHCSDYEIIDLSKKVSGNEVKTVLKPGVIEMGEEGSGSDEEDKNANEVGKRKSRPSSSGGGGSGNLVYEASQSSNDSDTSSVFEMGEDNLFMCLNQATKVVIPPPVSLKCFFQDVPDKSEKKKALVVVVRDLGTDSNNNYSLARALKEKLRRNKIKCYIISVPNLMKDLQAIQVTKSFANKIAKENSDSDTMEGYMKLILAVVDEKMQNKKGRVIIVDVGDEFIVRLLPIKDFCIRSLAEVFTMERLPDEVIDSKLINMSNDICDRFNKFMGDWKDEIPLSDGQLERKCLKRDETSNHLTPSRPHSQDLNSTEPSYETSDKNESESSFSESDLENEFLLTDDPSTSEALELAQANLLPKKIESINNNTDNYDYRTGMKIRRRKKRLNSAKDPSNHSSENTLGLRESLSSHEIRFNGKLIDYTDSEKSVILNEQMGQKPKLLKYHRINENENILTQSNEDQDWLYKGWVADVSTSNERYIPATPPLNFCQKFRMHRTNARRAVIKWTFRPLWNLITCRKCRQQNRYRIAPMQQQGYHTITFEEDDY